MTMTKQEIRDLVDDNLPDNASALITPLKHREVLLEVINSMWSLATGEPTQTSGSAFIHGMNHNFTGGLQQNGNAVWTTTKAVIVNSMSDLPTPAGGVITLLTNRTYLLGNDINVSSDRFVFSDRSVLRGVESLNITLTYTGTGDLFTMNNVTARVSNLTINAASGRLFNWTSTGGLELRVNDVQSTSAKYGIFNGSSSILRFTNVSPVVSADGLEFTGTFASVLWEVSGALINGGSFFKLGTATFNSFLVDKVLMTLAGGTTFIDGLADSGNIQAGGLGTVLLTRISGAGTPLSGVDPNDALWEFFHNDEIQDTRPDALLSLQGNAVAETISVSGTPVKVIGNNTWVDERSSQSTNDNTGKSTYDGGKPVVVPITLRGSVEPASGTNKTISLYVALNGTPIANSRATVNADAGDPKSVTVIWQEEAQPGAFIEMYASNDTDTTNVLVSSGIIRIN